MPAPAMIATLLVTLWVPSLQAGQPDGIAAIVDDEVISIGQVRRAALLLRDRAARGVLVGCAAEALDAADTLVGARECLIDMTLMFREARRFPQLLVSDAEVDAAIDQLRASAPSTEDLATELQRWQLSETELHAVVHRQLLVAAYVDTRFRATVQVTDEAVERAWNEELVPDLRARGIAVPSLDEVAQTLVRPLLQEREVNRLVQSWISDLRARAIIQRRFP